MPGKEQAEANRTVRDTARTPGLNVKTDDISNANQIERLQGADGALQALECSDSIESHSYFDHPYWPTFRKRVAQLLSRLPPEVDHTTVMGAARDAWERLCDATWNSGNNMAEAMRQANGGNVPLTSPNFVAAMEAFNTLVDALTSYSSSQFGSANSFGFWSRPEGKQLAENACDLTLETSGIGTLLDGLPSIDHRHMSWDLQLWGALSRAYADAVARQVSGGKKKIHVCIGAGSDASNIWGSIESAAMEAGLQGTGVSLRMVATYHAAAPVSLKDRSLDTTRRGGAYPGTLYSGGDVAEARRVADDNWDAMEQVERDRRIRTLADARPSFLEPSLGDHPYLAIGKE